MSVLVIDFGEGVSALGVGILAGVLAALTLHPREGFAQNFDAWLLDVLER